ILGDEKSTKYFYDYLNFYADNYDKFELHGDWVGKARVGGQSLDEAVWGLALVRTILACKQYIPEERLNYWYTKLFRPMADILYPQANSIHNISLWIMCCVGGIGVCFNDQELIDKAVNSKYGIREQVRQGFTADGVWRECSLTYHYYVAQSLTQFMPMYATINTDDKMFEIMEKLFTSPLAFSHDGETLQAMNDGWYPVKIESNYWMENSVLRLFDNENLVHDVKKARQTEKLGYGSGDLLYDYIDDEVDTYHEIKHDDMFIYPSTNFGFITKPFHMILKSGVVCSTHMHRDYMSIMLPPFSDDLGTPAYSHPLMNSWYKDPPAHNDVCVDGTQPWPRVDIIHSHVEMKNGSIIGIIGENEWDGIKSVTRTLTPNENSVDDVTCFESDSSHVYDWFFHSFGDESFNCDGDTVESLNGGRAYQHLKCIKKMNCVGSFVAKYNYNGKNLVVTIPVDDNTEIYTMKTPSNPSDSVRNTIMLRQCGNNAKFKVNFEII
ncbi:MAG: heparinase II/III-family protein, partial [Clostridia bacterium]|nr:heparinase II/III-family protein [Clostridia bacterium]